MASPSPIDVTRPPRLQVGCSDATASKEAATSSRSDVVDRIAAAFACGLSRAGSDGTPAALREFATLMDRSISHAIPAAEWAFIRARLGEAEISLQSSRQGLLEDAGRRYDEIWRQVEAQLPAMSIAGQMLTDVFLKPGYAYLRYRLEDHDGARDIIRHISYLGHRLATEHGMVQLGVHRLQLANNLLRIHTRLGQRHDAMRLGAMLLDYIELRTEPRSHEVLSPRSLLDASPEAILEHYFDKIAGDLGVVLAGDATAGNVRHAGSDAGGCRPDFAPRAHAWIRMRQAALEGDAEACLELAVDLLQAGQGAAPSLWFATVLEVATQCRSVGGDAFDLGHRMLNEAATLSAAPWELKRAVSGY
jgi:hypothetical protein